MQPILDLITERQAGTAATIADLREQIGKLTDELRLAETELSELVTTRTTLTRLTSTSDAAIPNSGTLDNAVYQQILVAFQTSDNPTMRARDVCHAIGLGTEHNDTEGIRAKLKRLVKRGILTEIGVGQFTLTAPAERPATGSSNSNSNPKRSLKRTDCPLRAIGVRCDHEMGVRT